jgi:hypothetical protein
MIDPVFCKEQLLVLFVKTIRTTMSAKVPAALDGDFR